MHRTKFNWKLFEGNDCFMYENEERSSVRMDYFNGDEREAVAGSVEEFLKSWRGDAAKLRMVE